VKGRIRIWIRIKVKGRSGSGSASMCCGSAKLVFKESSVYEAILMKSGISKLNISLIT
jgi:hypothetical protein